MKKAGGTETKIIGASVDLRGLHMASDEASIRSTLRQVYRFRIPFAVFPDRSDVPKNAARPIEIHG